ncbi:SurA N-terminal domain-containing protein [Legionella spiritensis]|uniref:Periplasmic chaperone PpiD n=1 Tax=Legionella spiritensis TaxID=452 RepID=A0A0W0YXC4_LEGSP|nr:SurA N-terminal domain-containing protein [Legionella spiritensis]KTD61496.1 peptidyl-prolyl cis-trans isomerase D [Legionella spiritensis]SNV33054.1 peptidyl-prolyl cis-trans isomerase D [Legionella spiritensis]
MLQKLNERIQGVVAWIVIILIAVTFTLFGVDYYMQSHQATETEVTVNGEAISKQAFEISYRRARQQRDSSQMTAAGEAALKKQVLNNMITTSITVQAAKSAGFEVSPEQANAAILSIPQFQQDGHFSAERYQLALSGAMFTPETFQKEVRQGMLLNQQRFAFMGNAFALPEEIKRFVKLYMQTRDYNYLRIPIGLFTSDIKISEQDIADYYKKHTREFTEPEKVSIDFVKLSMQQVRKNIKVSDNDIQRYYEDNQSNFLTPARWQVSHILFAVPENAGVEQTKQIREKADEAYQALQNNPAQFSRWVKTMSSDKLSAANDGVLPWIVAGSTEFDKALSELSQPGQISEPLKTSKGYEIFKLLAYQPASLKPLNQVRKDISEQLATELAQASYAQLLEQLTDLSFQTPDTLTPVAEELKLDIEQTQPFSRQGGQTELTKNKQIINTAFSHDVLGLGNNSEPVQLDNDSVIVLRVNKHIAAKAKSLDEVRTAIVNKLTQQKAKKEARQFGMNLLSGKSSPQEQERFIQDKKLQWREVDSASRDTDKADTMINDLAFSLPRVNSREGRSLINGDYVIVQLKKINEGRYKALDKEQQTSLVQQIESSNGIMDYDLYVKSLVARAKIERSN